jgi:hypothetical protein
MFAGVAEAAPTPGTTAPSIAPVGPVQQGQTLTVTQGSTWIDTTGTPTITDQWESCLATICIPVGSASSSTYVVASTDVGRTIKVAESATDATTTTPVPGLASNALGPVAGNSVLPKITGTSQEGQLLALTPGIWTGLTATDQWESCAGVTCAAVGTLNSLTYTPGPTDVGHTIQVVETAGPLTATSNVLSSVAPLSVPVNTAAPTISGTAQQGQTLTLAQGTWANSPASITHQWEQCSAVGAGCTAIPGQIGPTYTLGPGDVGHTIAVMETAANDGGPGLASSLASPVASATSATSVVAFSQNTPTTNQAVTLVATVISNSGNANPHGSLSFFDGSGPVPGCAGKGVNGGQTVTIVCQAAFPAGAVQISAAYVADQGALVAGSSSDATPVSIGKGPTSISLAVTPKVAPGGRATYVATVAVPDSNAGPTLPRGSIEFLDRGQPVGACASEALSNLTATCSVSYPSPGTHSISALYNGDSNFTGSTSPASSVQIVKGAAKAPSVRGSLGSTLGWRVNYHPRYSEVTALEAFAVPKGTSILVQCFGKGCPFAKWHLTKAAGTINLLARFRHRHLRAGTRITVRLTRRHWIGKYYSITIRPGRPPMTRSACLGPSAVKPGVGCSTHHT